jgi:beta-galactosidase GanA
MRSGRDNTKPAAHEPDKNKYNYESECIMYQILRSRARQWAMAIIALAAFCGTTASAHHSFAKFEMGKLTTLTGTVQEWTWANPHTWLKINVKKANGKTETWALVGSSPNMMSRWGWKAADIKAGDKIVIDVFRGRDGSAIGAMRNLFLSNGKVLVDPAGSTGQALAGGPGKTPTKPQGTPYK